MMVISSIPFTSDLHRVVTTCGKKIAERESRACHVDVWTSHLGWGTEPCMGLHVRRSRPGKSEGMEIKRSKSFASARQNRIDGFLDYWISVFGS